MSLQLRTNGPEFDFAAFDGPPPVRYVLAATPRCGSNMLARALWHTGRAGFPDGYLTDAYVLDFFERWGFDAADPAERLKGYVRRVMECRTSPNGVFGIKVHAGHLPGLEVELDELLLSPRYIWLRRRDRLRQAISYTLANQTGVWILDGTYLPMGRDDAELRYGYAEIRRALRHLERETKIWRTYFDRLGIAPHVVFYEDLLSRYEETLLGCLRHLGVTPPARLPGPGIRRQAGETTERWAEMYLRDDAMRRARDG